MEYCPHSLALKIKEEAFSLGFDACGIAKAGKLNGMELLLSEWLGQGNHGEMTYLENHFEKRLNPSLLVEGAKSVVVVALNYLPDIGTQTQKKYVVSKYAYGMDYHRVLKGKLRKLEQLLKEWNPLHRGRIFVDSAPVMEKVWAVRAGLGWIGKNTCLIIPGKGSFFFLGELITNIELSADMGFEAENCGNCTRCFDACPTGALAAPGKLITPRCISYLTIELKGKIPHEYRDGRLKGRIFGCDICQDACPHNRFAQPAAEPLFKPGQDFLTWPDSKWENLSREDFEKHFVKAKSAISRIGFEKFRDNIEFVRTDQSR
ncbi:MAG TPA: tRNA epoxyqueuosine(34) reductase QueG [Bacteroidales bacterium]|nr:tRNA epoxyqueuosine(34) reductase QueG [Bacteroidales bacterium]